MSTPTLWGSEFLVNTTTSGMQNEPAMTALRDGRFLAVWTDFSGIGGDSSSSGIKAQIFAADGTKAGGEFLVNTTTTQGQDSPVVTTLADGRMAVAWVDRSTIGTGDGSGDAIRLQLLNPNGTLLGTEILVNTIISGDQLDPAIITLTNGNFVVSWTDYSSTPPDSSGSAVRAQIFDPAGTKVGPEFIVNTATLGEQAESALAALTSGRMVAVWTDASQSGSDTSGRSIRAQILNADGTAYGSPIEVNTITAGDQTLPHVTALANGRFAITWTDWSASPDDLESTAVRGQIFRANGVKEGGEFLVNTTLPSSQWRPAMATLNDGRFIVVWQDASQTGADPIFGAIRAQVFNVNGTKSGIEFLVNTVTDMSQTRPGVTVLADGRVVVTWEDNSLQGGDNSVSAAKAQILDPRTTGLVLDGTDRDDSYHGTGFIDTIRGLARNDSLYGYGGNDVLDGNGGDDMLDGGAGSDTLRGGGGSDQLFGRAGEDVLDGGTGDDVLIGGRDNDVYILDSLADVVTESADGGTGDTVQSSVISLFLASYANVEHVRLTGTADLNASGNDVANVLNGNDGNNLLRGLGGHDTIYGSGGNDRIQGGAGSDYLDGGEGNDELLGASENDLMFGGGGDDVLNGGSGNDTIDGGSGNDTLTGGTGSDTFVFAPSHGTATITDFADGFDLINLQAFGFADAATARSFAANVGSDVVFTFAPGNVLTVLGVTKAQLAAADFIL